MGFQRPRVVPFAIYTLVCLPPTVYPAGREKAAQLIYNQVVFAAIYLQFSTLTPPALSIAGTAVITSLAISGYTSVLFVHSCEPCFIPTTRQLIKNASIEANNRRHRWTAISRCPRPQQQSRTLMTNPISLSSIAVCRGDVNIYPLGREFRANCPANADYKSTILVPCCLS
jgi:hypothetical protein